MPTIRPFLWFDGNVEAAMDFYTSIFPDARILDVSRGEPDEAGVQGPVSSARFMLQGQEFMALNGGPHFTFSPAVSFFVSCDSQEEVDTYWEKLSAGGEKQRCGWLKDPFGLSWQIIPSILGELLHDDDDEKAGRVMQAMLAMDKIDIAGLQKAYDG